MIRMSRDDRLAQALRLAADGWLIFPLRADSKRPMGGSWLAMRTTDADTIRFWADDMPDCNFAVSPGPGRLIVDLDTKGGIDGIDAFDALQIDNGAVSTLEVETPSGGRHLYLTLPDGMSADNSSKGFPAGIDVRGQNGYCVAPGSTVGGRTYCVIHDRPVAEARPWVCDRLQPFVARDRNALTEPEGGWDRPEAVSRARAWLVKRDPAVEGDGGNNFTYETAAHLRDFGLSPEKSLEVMTDGDHAWNERCDPPWRYDDLAAVVWNAHRYGRNAPGSKLADLRSFKEDDPACGADRPDAATDWKAVLDARRSTLRDTMAREPAPLREIVEGFIEQGTVNVWKGGGSSAKSMMALTTAMCVAAGKTPLSFPPFRNGVVQCPTVFLSAEDDQDVLDRRQRAIRTAYGIDDDRVPCETYDLSEVRSAMLVVGEDGEATRTPFGEEIARRLTAHGRHTLLFLDSAYDFFRFGGHAKVDEDAVNDLIKHHLKRFCSETDSTIVMLWHPSQAGLDRGDFSGWSTAWVNAPRMTLGFRKLSPSMIEISVPKRNHAAEGATWKFVWQDDALVTPHMISEDAREEALYRSVVAAAIELSAVGEPEKRGKGPQRASKAIQEIVKRHLGDEAPQDAIAEKLTEAVRRGDLDYYAQNKTQVTSGYHEPGLNRPTWADIAAGSYSKARRRKIFRDKTGVIDVWGPADYWRRPSARIMIGETGHGGRTERLTDEAADERSQDYSAVGANGAALDDEIPF